MYCYPSHSSFQNGFILVVYIQVIVFHGSFQGLPLSAVWHEQGRRQDRCPSVTSMQQSVNQLKDTFAENQNISL